MDKFKMLKIVNAALIILFVTQSLSGMLAEHLPRGLFGVVHGGGGLLFVLAGICHLVLNWGWVKNQFFKKA
jgi:hypothetical protein